MAAKIIPPEFFCASIFFAGGGGVSGVQERINGDLKRVI